MCVCGILTHHDSTGSLVCENSMSLPSVVKAWTNLLTRLQFDDYLFILSWNEIIDVWKCVFLYRLLVIRFCTSVQWQCNSCNLFKCRFLTIIESVHFFANLSKKKNEKDSTSSIWLPKFRLFSFRHLRVTGNRVLRRCRRWNRTVTLSLNIRKLFELSSWKLVRII